MILKHDQEEVDEQEEVEEGEGEGEGEVEEEVEEGEGEREGQRQGEVYGDDNGQDTDEYNQFQHNNHPNPNEESLNVDEIRKELDSEEKIGIQGLSSQRKTDRQQQELISESQQDEVGRSEYLENKSCPEILEDYSGSDVGKK